MKAQQSGFTLVELIVVIVILGILSATALPKFVNLKGDAEISAAEGVAGGLASASAINYGAKMAGATVTPATLAGHPVGVCNSTALGPLLTSGWPTGYTVAAATGAAICTAGGTTSCTVTKGTGTATFGITCY